MVATLRIEQVDNWHDSWSRVLRFIEVSGARKKLRIDKDGWLSARQVLMVAFEGKSPAGFVSFVVTPTKAGSIEARQVSHAVDPKLKRRDIELQLYRAAAKRSKALGCARIRGRAVR